MTEPKVVRYAFYGDDGEANPVENPGGGWVDYDDYKALAARVQELESLEYRECRNAALEEAATVPVPFRHANTEAARAIHAAIRALEEKP